MSKYLHAADNDHAANDKVDDNDDAKAIAIPRVFSENSRAKNEEKFIDTLIKNEKNVGCIGV